MSEKQLPYEMETYRVWCPHRGREKSQAVRVEAPKYSPYQAALAFSMERINPWEIPQSGVDIYVATEEKWWKTQKEPTTYDVCWLRPPKLI